MNNNTMTAPAISKGNYDDAQGAWGLLATINLYECDPELIKSPLEMRKFIVALCELIDMKRFGEPLIQRFAEGPLEGYSMMQFIETSSITVHFDEERNRAFIDIFSCKYFNTDTAAVFCRDFFKASEYKIQTLIRN